MKVIDFERDAAQPEFVGHGGRRPRIVLGSNEARQLHRGAATRWAKHDDLGAGARDATDGVDEFAFDERPAVDFKPESNEERHGSIEVGHCDADVIERSELTHQTRHSQIRSGWRSIVSSDSRSSSGVDGSLSTMTPRCSGV